MKYLALFCFLFAGCHTSRPPAELAGEPQAISNPAIDSVVVEPHRSLLDKVIGRKPQKDIVAPQLPARIGKKSTVSVYCGPATVTTVGKKATAATAEGATVTAIGKVKAPTAVGDSATAQDYTKQGQRGGAVASGDGATATAMTKKKSLWEILLPSLGILGCIGLVWWLVAGGGAVTLAALWRKNKPDNQA